MEKEMATHSSISWRILWTEGPGGLLSIGLHRVRHDWSNFACMGQEGPLEEVMATHFSIHARKKSHEQKTLTGYGQWGRKVSGIIKQEHQAPVYL